MKYGPVDVGWILEVKFEVGVGTTTTLDEVDVNWLDMVLDSAVEDRVGPGVNTTTTPGATVSVVTAGKGTEPVHGNVKVV